MEPLLFIAESESEQRLGERLARLGIPLELATSSRLTTARQGAWYLLTAERATSFQPEAITSTGAHLCVIPPWPTSGLSLKHNSISPAATARRDPIELDAALAAMLPTSERIQRRLTIAYREHLSGLAGKTLGVSLSGETVLLALPRVSNLHGLLIVTTLLIGQPSAQTVSEDVARLLQALGAWMRAQSGASTSSGRPSRATALFDPDIEHQAQLVLLALVLHLTKNQISANLMPSMLISSTEVQPLAEQIASIFGLSMTTANFQLGWQALETLGILFSSDQPSLSEQRPADMMVDGAKAHERLDFWQLSPRLRRLRQSLSNLPASQQETAEYPVQMVRKESGADE